MSDWTDDYLPADIEGVPFKVSMSSMPVGRRIVAESYPFSDDYWVDEMGQEMRVLRIEGFILDKNGDLKEQREAIFEVLKKPGTLKLTHPRLGELEVEGGPAVWRTVPGGRENITMNFYPPKRKKKVEAKVKPNTLSTVTSALESARETLTEQVKSQLNLKGFGLLDRAQGFVDKGLQVLRDVNARIAVATAPISEIAQSIRTVGDELGDLIRQPAALASSIGSVLGAVYGTVNTASNAFLSPSQILESATGSNSAPRMKEAFANYQTIREELDAIAPVVGTTPTRNQERQNQAALTTLLQTTAVLSLVEYVASETHTTGVTDNQHSPFDSVDQANAKRDELVAAIDAQAEAAGGDVYVALQPVRAAIVAHLENHGQSLPRLHTVKYANDLPALVIAYKFYGDARRVDDLVRRNGIRNPLHVPAYTPLEVLREV